jgi:hypothetical protein
MMARVRELDILNKPVDIAYHLQIERWNGSEYLQAKLLDIRAAH